MRTTTISYFGLSKNSNDVLSSFTSFRSQFEYDAHCALTSVGTLCPLALHLQSSVRTVQEFSQDASFSLQFALECQQPIVLPSVARQISIPLFRFNITESVSTYPTFRMFVGDVIVFECPKVSKTSRASEDYLYLSIYEVSREEANSCTVRDTSRLLINCSNPRVDRKVIFRRANPSGEHFYITTSTGSFDGIDKQSGGLCSSRNMRIKIELLETHDRKLESYYEGTYHLFDSSEVFNSDESSNEDSRKQPNKLTSQQVGDVIDIGVYKGPPLTLEEWRNAFKENYTAEQPTSAESFKQSVSKHIVFGSTNNGGRKGVAVQDSKLRYERALHGGSGGGSE
ncbi:hypothetical protein L596_004369 [Steinernema carpocapsae]|uniref:Ephrin RBD domain-containing protein n=1 Tax=Steinernema carpocapsae TaxID=34508 RepID=A0A4U8UX44_STECR|nr:hypothetical protein L596_004369 [Steinernema carpocapsae]